MPAWRGPLRDQPPRDLRQPVVERGEGGEREADDDHDRVLLGGCVLELEADRDHGGRELAAEPEDRLWPRPARARAVRVETAPPQIVAVQLKKRRPTGTNSPTAAAIAMYANPGIGAEYMPCIHASTPSTAIATTEPAAALWLKSGLREKVGTISEIMPTAPTTIRGACKIQLRCEEQERLAVLAWVEEHTVELPVDGQHCQRQHRRADDEEDVPDRARGPREGRSAAPGQAGRRMFRRGCDQLIAKHTNPERPRASTPPIHASTC